MTVSSITMPFPARLKMPLRLDPVLLTLALTLLLGGLIILASASISISDGSFGRPFYYVERQLVAVIIGAIAGFICLFIPMRVWSRLGPLMLLLSMVLLLVVLLPGVGYTVNGSTRWVRFGVMNLQVSEPARLCLIMYLAGYLVRRNKSLREEIGGFLRPMVVLSLACVLLLAEPDFGAALVLLATALTMLFVAGARWRDFLLFFGMAVFGMATLAITSAYRMQRLTAFLDPWADQAHVRAVGARRFRARVQEGCRGPRAQLTRAVLGTFADRAYFVDWRVVLPFGSQSRMSAKVLAAPLVSRVVTCRTVATSTAEKSVLMVFALSLLSLSGVFPSFT